MEVKVWEEAIIIPTYGVGESEKNPMFLEKESTKVQVVWCILMP
jgi:hypothetical protein